MVLPLRLDEVHLWMVAINRVTDSRLHDACRALLHADEAERCSKLRFERDRRQFLISHALVRIALSHYAPVAAETWRFAANAYGRPEIADRRFARLRFNLSHTDGMAVCALASDMDVGVDVEDCWHQGRPLAIAGSVLSPEEMADVEALPVERQQRRFFEYWTLKEAYLKARGIGLNLPLAKFAFNIGLGRPPRIRFDPFLDEDPEAWQFVQVFLSERHVAAVAVRRRHGLPIALRCRLAQLPGCG